MKKLFIADIRAGDAIDDFFALSDKNVAQKRDGKSYLNIVLADKTGRLKGVVWDQVARFAEIASGDYVKVKGTVSEYRGELQVVVKDMVRQKAEALEAADFIPATQRNIEEMFNRLTRLCDSMQPGGLRTLVQAFWQDAAFVRQFKAAPAAKMMHHAYIGGLLEHTLSMAILCDKVAEHYGGIDRDLLLAGAILHDIGKTEELAFETKIDYTDQGRLVNHIIIGLRLIEEKVRQTGELANEKILLLKHLIVSHHGARELGSPEPPKTMEAVLLHYADEIDSKINGIREFMAQADPNEKWTPYHRILERHFYKGDS